MRREAPGPAYLDLDLPEPPRTQARERKTSITPATPRGWHGFMRVTGMPAHTAATLATSGSPTGHPTTSTWVSVSAPRAQSRRTRGSTPSPHRSSRSQSPTGLGGAQSSPRLWGERTSVPQCPPRAPLIPPLPYQCSLGGGLPRYAAGLEHLHQGQPWRALQHAGGGARPQASFPCSRSYEPHEPGHWPTVSSL